MHIAVIKIVMSADFTNNNCKGSLGSLCFFSLNMPSEKANLQFVYKKMRKLAFFVPIQVLKDDKIKKIVYNICDNIFWR